MLRIIAISSVLLCVHIGGILGHGMMLDPPNRSSVWRFYEDAPINYDDNANVCGGRSAQWELFGGQCGVCGDNYGDPHPQENENGGRFGNGKVVAFYESGSTINVSIQVTSNHLGNFQYSLCVLENPALPESGEDCFEPLALGDGSLHYNVQADDQFVYNLVKLPDDLICNRCVLRWHYTAGNSWGNCDNSTAAVGCGPQETFRSCADITIVPNPHQLS